MKPASRSTNRSPARVQSEGAGKFLCSAILSALVAISTGCLSASAVESRTPTEWMIVQNEDSCGVDTLFLTHDAVKVINQRLGCQLIAKAPDWKVHCFQPRDRLEWIGKMEYFSGRSMLNPYYSPTAPVPPIPLKSIGAGVLKGLRYKKFGVEGGFLYFAEDISVSSHVAEFLARLYNSPLVPAVPLYSCNFIRGTVADISKHPEVNGGITHDMRTGLRVNLDTVSCRKVPYKSSDFDTPLHYQRSGDIVSVTLSGDKKSLFNEMLNNVGFMSPNGGDKQKDRAKH